MYSRYAERQGWRVEVLNLSDSGAGGIKEVIALIEGRGVYSRLKYESGVHRVQRVPATEASGRIHTSTATVAVLPEAEEVDIHIDAEGPAHRHVLLERTRRPERQHHLLRRPHHPHPDRHRGVAAGREVAGQEPREGDEGAALAALRDGDAQAAGGDRQGSADPGRAPASDPRRSAPTTSARTGSPITGSASRCTSSPRRSTATSASSSTRPSRYFTSEKLKEATDRPNDRSTRDALVHERLAEARASLVRRRHRARTRRRSTPRCWRATCSAGTAPRLLTRAPRPAARRRSTGCFDALVARRAAREPVAYIIGHREFWGLEFEVTPDVLIPRPETELIVEEALARLPQRDPVRQIVDVGTGSGCIAVALARRDSRRRASPRPTSRTRRWRSPRGTPNGTASTGRIAFVQGDLLQAVDGPVDLIVSNPPYVPAGDAPTLQPEVARLRAGRSALFGGERRAGCACDGCSPARRDAACARRAGSLLNSASGRNRRVRDAAQREPAGRSCAFVSDLQGIPRVAVARGGKRGGLSVLQDRRGRDSRRRSSTRTITSSPSRTSTRRRRLHVLVVPRRHIATPQRPHAGRRRARRRDGAPRRRWLAKERGLRASAATARSSTATPTRARRCSTSTCTCSAGATMAWPPG